jgi:hypothetical protein
LLLFSLYGVITVTLAPLWAAVSSALVTLPERSQALRQIVCAFGMIVEKNVEATFVSVFTGCVGAGVCKHAVSTKLAPADGLGEGDAACEDDGDGDADGATEDDAAGEGEADAMGSGDEPVS